MKKLDQIQETLRIINENSVSPEEFASSFAEVLDFVKKIKESNDQELEDVKSLFAYSNKELTAIKTKVDSVRDGLDYVLTSSDKKEIASLIDVPIVEKLIQHTETIKELPVVREVAIKETPDETVDKVNASNKTIQMDRIAGLTDLDRIARNNQAPSFPITTSFFNGLRGKNLNIVGGAATVSGDTVNVTVSTSGLSLTTTGTSGAATLVGSILNIPIYSGGGGSGYQAPLSGALTGTNTWTSAPSVLVIDGVPRRQTQSDGTVNWTGTTTTVLTGAPLPNFDIFAL